MQLVLDNPPELGWLRDAILGDDIAEPVPGDPSTIRLSLGALDHERQTPRPDPGSDRGVPAFAGEIRFDYDDTLLVGSSAGTRVVASRPQRTVSLELDAFDRPDEPRSTDIRNAALVALAWTTPGVGIHVVHGAAGITRDGLRFLIPGASGAGKTTTALAIALSGGRLVADDTLFWNRHTGVTTGLRRELHLGAPTLAMLRRAGWERDVDADPLDNRGRRFIPAAAVLRPEHRLSALDGIDAILLPTIVEREVTRVVTTTLSDVSEALIAASPTCLMGSARFRQEAMRSLLELGMTRPVWRMELGRDLLDAPEAIARALRPTAHR